MHKDWMIGAYCLCPVCLFVCLFVCLSVVNFNLRFNFWTVRDRDFTFGMHTPLMTPFQMTPRSMTCDLDFDLGAKNSFLASRDKYVRGANVIALPSASVSASASVAWTKTLTLAITLKPEVIGLSYCTCVFLVIRPFTRYHNFLPCDLEVWPTYEKLSPWL